MKKIILLVLLVANPAFAYVIKESRQDEDVTICTNQGGSITCEVAIDGATGNLKADAITDSAGSGSPILPNGVSVTSPVEVSGSPAKVTNTTTNGDLELCVNDDGVEKCLNIDGPTAAVSVPADFSVTGSITGGTFDGTLGTGTVSGGTGGVITDGTITGTDIASETITSSNFDCSITGNTKRCLCISNVDGGI